MRIRPILLSVLLLASAGCSTPLLSPYKMEIRQGNYVTQEMRERLKIGMTRAQVRYALGTPMVADPFHTKRWDYVYMLEQRGEVVQRQHLAVFFDGDNLVRVEEGGKLLTDIPALVVEPPEPVPAESVPVEPAQETMPAAPAADAAAATSN